MKKIKTHSNTKVESKQILLCNTNRNSKDFLNSIKFRLNGNYKKVPNYLIEKSGKINNLNIDASIKDYVKKGNSILGICLGMQLLMDSSDELGKNKGLSLIPGNVKKIPNEVCNILPNIGYYQILHKDKYLNQKNSLIFYH